MGRTASPKVRRAILRSQNYTCPGNDMGTFACGKRINIRTAELHHQWQDAAGGPDEYWNYVALCKECHKEITGHQNTKYW